MKTGAPLVSVVIPTYNHAHFLKEALESVHAQTYPYWEAIIVNNFSEDDTIEVIGSFNDAFRLRLVNFRNHGVIAASRNEGIRHAHGEFVAFLDSDDTWQPEKLARCVESLQAGCDLVCHGEIWTYENGVRRQVSYGPTDRARYDRLLYGANCISTSATVVRKVVLDQLGGFSENPEFVTAEDYELWLRISKASHRFCFIPDMLGEYRIHGDNASKAVFRNTNAILAVIGHHFAQENEPGLWRQLRRRKRFSAALGSGAWGLKHVGDYRGAVLQSGKALKLWPLNWKAYAAGLLTIIEWAKRSGMSLVSRA